MLAKYGALIEIAAANRVAPEELSTAPMEFLRQTARLLGTDAHFRRTEDLEWVFKAALLAAISRGVQAPMARQIAQLQAQLGFLMKYKSYAIKATSPLGYSIFLQQPGEGFSIQLHADHKVEVFHILGVSPGSFVLLAHEDEWRELAGSHAMSRLLKTGDTSELAHVAYHPKPGDTIVVQRPGIVHTVVGCVLEEFATASTDMVVRLHDQNEGRPIPGSFHRGVACAKLTNLPVPEMVRHVYRREGKWHAEEGQKSFHDGWTEMTLGSVGRMRGARIEVAAGARAPIAADDRAVSVFVQCGEGRLGIPSILTDPSPLPLRSGVLTTIAPGTPFELSCARGRSLVVSAHHVPVEVAFVEQIER